jgi:hypothetical protein
VASVALGNFMRDAGERAPDGFAVEDDFGGDVGLLPGLSGPG